MMTKFSQLFDYNEDISFVLGNIISHSVIPNKALSNSKYYDDTVITWSRDMEDFPVTIVPIKEPLIACGHNVRSDSAHYVCYRNDGVCVDPWCFNDGVAFYNGARCYPNIDSFCQTVSFMIACYLDQRHLLEVDGVGHDILIMNQLVDNYNLSGIVNPNERVYDSRRVDYFQNLWFTFQLYIVCSFSPLINWDNGNASVTLAAFRDLFTIDGGGNNMPRDITDEVINSTCDMLTLFKFVNSFN